MPNTEFNVFIQNAPAKTLTLFPKEMYDTIPDGFIVTDIFEEQFSFEKGKTNKDDRLGYLAYGIKKD